MATPRNSGPVDFGTVQQPAIQSSQLGNAQADPNKNFNPTQGGSSTSATSVLDGLLSIIAPAANKIASVDMQTQQEEAYLRGSAAAGTRQAEDEIESNILTKNWATAGYRDTTSRMKAADSEAQLAVDMKRLREQPPEKFEEYLAQRRTMLMEGTGGMSREGRKAMLSQILTSDQAAIQKHATAHAAYIIDTRKDSISASLSAQFASLRTAKVDAKAYGAASISTFNSLLTDVWNNPSLPQDVRESMAVEAMNYALAENHQALYQVFRDQPVKLANGKTGTMFDQLSFKEQTKLSNAYEKSLGDTRNIASSTYHGELGTMLSSFDNPNAPGMAIEEVNAFLDKGVGLGWITAEKKGSVIKQWNDATYKKQTEGNHAALFSSGNTQAQSDSGTTDEQRHAAWRGVQTRLKKPVEQIVAEEFEIAMRTGSPAAFKSYGQAIAIPLGRLGVSEEETKAQAAVLNGLLQRFEGLDYNQREAALSVAMSPLNDAQREKLSYFRMELQRTGNPEVAAQNAVKRQLDNEKMTGPEKAAKASATYKEDKEIAAKLDMTNVFKVMWGKIGFGATDEARWNLSRYSGWFSDERSTAQQVPLRAALLDELKRQSLSDPNMDAGTRESNALSAIYSRLVPIGDTYLVVPPLAPGQTLGSFFGLRTDDAGKSSAGPESIGKALEQKIPKLLSPDNYRVMKMAPSGRILWEERSPDKALPVNVGEVDPKTLGPIIDEVDNKRRATTGALYGNGVTVPVGDGKVTYNGVNSVNGLRPEWMAELRGSLVKYEGFTAEPKDVSSTSGKALKVVGVGIASTNDFYPKPGPDGKISKAQLDAAFAEASNAAAKFGMTAAMKTGLANKKEAFELLSGMSYQANNINAKESYQPFLTALREKDAAKAKAEFQKTAVWKDAQGSRADGPSPRNKYYLQLIEKSLE